MDIKPIDINSINSEFCLALDKDKKYLFVVDISKAKDIPIDVYCKKLNFIQNNFFIPNGIDALFIDTTMIESIFACISCSEEQFENLKYLIKGLLAVKKDIENE